MLMSVVSVLVSAMLGYSTKRFLPCTNANLVGEVRETVSNRGGK
jgi:hypothetical protein